MRRERMSSPGSAHHSRSRKGQAPEWTTARFRLEAADAPRLRVSLQKIRSQAGEALSSDMQDVEFTIERGKRCTCCRRAPGSEPVSQR